MSCKSPFTVPTKIFPNEGTSASAINGFTIFMPSAIAFAAIMTSGTNISPALNLGATIFIPAIKPSLIIVNGSLPASISS